MKIVMNVVRKIVISAFSLYGYNLIATNFNMMIPINVITVGMMTLFGFPALLALILFKVFVL